uniref:Interferon phi 1 n=1 Tax=Oncorhynchus mykiss TaxID=8022 RepID=A0A8C7UEP0_ONCMY
MYTMQSWTCICLIICSMQSVCHCCDWSRHHYGHLSAEYLSLLDQMVSYQHTVEDKVRFRNEAIYKITKLFDGNMKSVTWNKKNLDDFLKILENQFENLNSCVSNRRLKRYFKKLNRKDYSASGWEDIRTVVLTHLQRLDTTLSMKTSTL